MDPYADEILEGLGLPTNIKKYRDLDYFKVLGIDPSVDSDDEIVKAASLRMRKVREFAKGGTLDYSREMERLIIQARNALSDSAKRQRYRQQIGISAGVSVEDEVFEVEGVRPSPGERKAYDKVAPAKGGGFGKIFLAVLIILIILAVIAIAKFGSRGAKEKGQELLNKGKDVVKDISK